MSQISFLGREGCSLIPHFLYVQIIHDCYKFLTCNFHYFISTFNIYSAWQPLRRILLLIRYNNFDFYSWNSNFLRPLIIRITNIHLCICVTFVQITRDVSSMVCRILPLIIFKMEIK